MSVVLSWLLFNAFIFILLALDLWVFHRKPHAVTVKEAVLWSFFWVGLALLFNVYIFYFHGKEAALNFFTGYLIEKSLSIDNLFIFLLIFKYFHTPITSQHKVLFWGVLGAIILRALFIWAGISLISSFHWMVYVFGTILVFSGIRLGLEKKKEYHPEKNPFLLVARLVFPVTHTYVDDKFFIWQQGKRYATPLLFVLIAIETTDLIFATDSIPAILAITHDPFIVYTSNIFAILGLRSLYFVLQRLMLQFYYLHYGLSVILVFIGLKMLISNYLHISTALTLGVMALVLLISITLSYFFPKRDIL